MDGTKVLDIALSILRGAGHPERGNMEKAALFYSHSSTDDDVRAVGAMMVSEVFETIRNWASDNGRVIG